MTHNKFKWESNTSMWILLNDAAGVGWILDFCLQTNG